MRLLVTRPHPQAEETAAELRALGHEVLMAPLLEIVTDPDVSLEPDGADLVVLTSRGAVRALKGHPGLPGIAAMPVLAVGEATAEAARAAGFSDVRAAGGDLLSVARAIETDPNLPRTVLHIAGRDRSGDLGALLGAAAVSVVTRVCYRAEPATALPADAAAALREGAIDGVLSFSPRSAATLVALAEAAGLGPALAEVRHFCLSHAVAEVLSGAGAGRVEVAATPDQAALLELIGSA
ncbi:uroporphyrinogen-III synthase [Amorphus suaedae]